MSERNDGPTDGQDEHTTGRGGRLNRRRLLQVASVGALGSTLFAAHSVAQESADRLEILVPRGESVAYTFTSDASVERIAGNSVVTAETDDTISESDGLWTVEGNSADGYGDAFALDGAVRSFEPTEGSYRLYLNGERIAREDLVDPLDDREHSYSFEATGDSWADYYLEVQDEGRMIASELDGATIDPDFHWISDDGTKAAGRIHPGDRHAYEFDNLVLDVTIDGQAEAYVDGRESDVDRYPLDGATGDGWKGGFPWQDEESLEDIEREHSYSFEATGDSWADYYLEVQDEGRMVATRLDGATIDPGFHWVSDDGTKAAGRVHPGDRHAYEFDNLVLDVTIEGGQVEAYVDGRESDVDRYPLDGATGDGWKGGFPWQDEEEQQEEETVDSGGVALGGGSGYGNIVTRDDADAVVQSASDLSDALSSASSGDVVFVPGDVTIDTGGRSMDVPSGVTLASNRGENGAEGALLHTDETPQIMLRPKADARVTGLRLRGHSPDRTVTHSDGISFDTPTYAMHLEGRDVEVDNCKVWGWPDRAVAVDSGGAHIHHNYIFDNNGQGLGYGVAAGEECLIEYNYFHNNRHSVTCAYDAPGYTARYNHFSPVSVMHICDIHDPFQGDTTIESNIIQNGESRTWDNPDAEGIAGYSDGFDGGSLSVTDNWFFDQGSAYFEDFGEVSDSGNVYGDEGAHDPTAVIPDHPGMDDRPWL